ncbi:MAG: VOC family protein [Candidatus Magasanikbacteria bacterium]
MPALNPYLSFDNNCEEAFNFYKSIFGNEFGFIQRFKDTPTEAQKAMSLNENEGEKIMHVALPIGNNSVLMGSDTPESIEKSRTGNAISISVTADNREQADKFFQELSEGGTNTMPMADAFWGSYFGMCTDKFGINWMISYDKNQKIERVVHFEIQADDIERAKKFYGDVFVWQFPKLMDDPIYWGIVTAPMGSGSHGIDGGLLQRPVPAPGPQQGTNAFVCTVVVRDFDETAKKIEKAGGIVALPKHAIPGMAWQGYFIDTEGNTFGIHQPDVNAK